jgi:hypothetical protein
VETIKWTDSESLLKLEEEVEAERKRLQGWAFIPEFKGTRHKELMLMRCRRLANIRENLRMLAETYE